MPVSGGFVNCTIDCNYAYSLPIRQGGVVKFDIWRFPHYFEWGITLQFHSWKMGAWT